jgi:hypothetical protein
MLGGCSHRGCSGSWNPLAWRCQVGVLNGLEVAGGALDAEPEQVTDAADVAAGGVDLAATPQRNQAHQSHSGDRVQRWFMHVDRGSTPPTDRH